MQKRDSTRHKPRLQLVPPQQPQPAADQLDCFTPAGFRDGDETRAVAPVDNVFAWLGVYEGDVALVYLTHDVTPDDMAAVEFEGQTWLGKYRPAPGGYFTFEQDGDVLRFKPGTALLLGRVCHVERRGEIIRRLRPVR